jgi:hypothetical protein
LASRRTALGGAALFIVLAAPATASAAPVVAPTVQCARYIPGVNTMGVTAAGFTPNAAVAFSINGSPVPGGTTTPAGAYATPPTALFAPPQPSKNVQTVTLSASDAGGLTASRTMKVVKLGVVVPDRAKPSRRVKYRVFGFQPGKRVYLFVRRGGKTKGRFTIGKPKGDCGTLTKKLRYMPLRHWSTGNYEYWYTQNRKYSKQTRIYGYRLNIFKTFG